MSHLNAGHRMNIKNELVYTQAKVSAVSDCSQFVTFEKDRKSGHMET
jgi:hypothetical protein